MWVYSGTKFDHLQQCRFAKSHQKIDKSDFKFCQLLKGLLKFPKTLKIVWKRWNFVISGHTIWDFKTERLSQYPTIQVRVLALVVLFPNQNANTFKLTLLNRINYRKLCFNFDLLAVWPDWNIFERFWQYFFSPK